MRRRKQAGSNAVVTLLASGATLLAMETARRIFRNHQLFGPTPDPVKSWNPEDYGIPRTAVEEHWIPTPDGELLHAWYCRSPKPIASGVFCHGNKGNLTTSADVIPHLLNAGFSVLFFDYRGFGRSTGSPSLDGVVADGITAAKFHERIRPKNLPSLLYGFSLGGAVAAQVIRRHRFDALILQSTFTDLPAVARCEFPRVPLYLLAGRVFDTLSVVKRLKVPLLVMHGSEDPTCPKWMAHALYDACPSPKRLEVIEGGLHKDLFTRDPDSLVWIINRFATEVPRAGEDVLVEQPSAAERVIDAALRTVRRFTRRRSEPQTL